jgi:hypothetical protein
VRSHIVRVEILDDVRFEKNVDKFAATLSTDNICIIPRLHLGVQLATVNIRDNESESVLLNFHCQLFESESVCTHNYYRVFNDSSCQNWISKYTIQCE